MNIIAVDDELSALGLLREAIEEAVPNCTLSAYDNWREALAYARQNAVDVAFLDIRMPGTNGLALAKELKEIHGQINIVFVSGYSEYAVSAFSLPASGYVLKPVTVEAVVREMENLRYPRLQTPQGIWIKTFGNFDVFADGVPVDFKLAKSKEILAYLVDRQGAQVEKRELAAILWEAGDYSRNRQIYLQELITEMVRALSDVGAGEIVRRWQGRVAVDVSKFACDYYDFLNGDAHAAGAYQGEYMSNYTWAEFTAGALFARKQNS